MTLQYLVNLIHMTIVLMYCRSLNKASFNYFVAECNLRELCVNLLVSKAF